MLGMNCNKDLKKKIFLEIALLDCHKSRVFSIKSANSEI
jgi:hypothetical protein